MLAALEDRARARRRCGRATASDPSSVERRPLRHLLDVLRRMEIVGVEERPAAGVRASAAPTVDLAAAAHAHHDDDHPPSAGLAPRGRRSPCASSRACGARSRPCPGESKRLISASASTGAEDALLDRLVRPSSGLRPSRRRTARCRRASHRSRGTRPSGRAATSARRCRAATVSAIAARSRSNSGLPSSSAKPSAIRLHHSVLDAVVDHLDEVARARRAAVQPAAIGRRREDARVTARRARRLVACRRTSARSRCRVPRRRRTRRSRRSAMPALASAAARRCESL